MPREVSSIGSKCGTKELASDDFIKQWWKKRFPAADEPIWNSAITCADAADLLNKYRDSVPVPAAEPEVRDLLCQACYKSAEAHTDKQVGECWFLLCQRYTAPVPPSAPGEMDPQPLWECWQKAAQSSVAPQSQPDQHTCDTPNYTDGPCYACAKEKVLEWIFERYENCIRLAAQKTGEDKRVWLEDADHFMFVLTLLKRPSVSAPSVNREMLAALRKVLAHGCMCHSTESKDWHGSRCHIPAVTEAIQHAEAIPAVSAQPTQELYDPGNTIVGAITCSPLDPPSSTKIGRVK